MNGIGKILSGAAGGIIAAKAVSKSVIGTRNVVKNAMRETRRAEHTIDGLSRLPRRTLVASKVGHQVAALGAIARGHHQLKVHGVRNANGHAFFNAGHAQRHVDLINTHIVRRKRARTSRLIGKAAKVSASVAHAKMWVTRKSVYGPSGRKG
jgi:hypothetical protein